MKGSERAVAARVRTMTSQRRVLSVLAGLSLVVGTYATGWAATQIVRKGVSVTISAGPTGLSVTTKGAVCAAPPTPTPVPTPSSSSPAVSCVSSGYQGLAVAVPKSTKQKIFFLQLQPYTVKDLTGTGNGWRVTIQASSFACLATVRGGCSQGDTLPTGSLFMAPPSVQCPAHVSCTGHEALPTVLATSNAAIDTTGGIKVASAAHATAMGIPYTFQPTTITCPAHDSGCGDPSMSSGPLELFVPSNVPTGNFGSTLVESVIAGP